MVENTIALFRLFLDFVGLKDRVLQYPLEPTQVPNILHDDIKEAIVRVLCILQLEDHVLPKLLGGSQGTLWL